jgi:hypothetical protein
MEATGVYGKRLVAALHQLRRTKNDRVDAGVVARFCLERKALATRPLRWVEEQLKVLSASVKAETTNWFVNKTGSKKTLIKLPYLNSLLASGAIA